MVSPALIAGGASLLGGLFGGKAKKKAAVNAAKLAAQLASDIDQAYARDQQSVKLLRAEDEARLASATGFDFQKLRDDAIKAGFNPLTVLQATGGAGYDGRGAVLATPFFSQGDAKVSGANLMMGAQADVVGTSGYVGDAISAASSAYFGQKNFDTAAAVDTERLRLDQIAVLGQRGRSGGGGGGGGGSSGVANTPFGSTVATDAKGSKPTFWQNLFGFDPSKILATDRTEYQGSPSSETFWVNGRPYTFPTGPDGDNVRSGIMLRMQDFWTYGPKPTGGGRIGAYPRGEGVFPKAQSWPSGATFNVMDWLFSGPMPTGGGRSGALRVTPLPVR